MEEFKNYTQKLAIFVIKMAIKDTRYINPESYLFLDQKRKLGLVKRIQKHPDICREINLV
ncbi:hypothetical protein [Lacihabitans sp. LS3-19]|uniref:hypothetical protein n=1 Tax=Lacihabitans sp. LS3-19 TaxID=2487335 RepID=UPI0020CC4810|nr:hypothetical protein [Lacihabitans sp. LS3-19]